MANINVKRYIIFIIIALLNSQCKTENPMEIKDCGVNVEGNGIISGLNFETRKDLIVFLNRMENDGYKRINIRNYHTSFYEYEVFNKYWYGDTIYIQVERLLILPIKELKYYSVFLTFKNRYGKSILQKSTKPYEEIKTYFNDLYIETSK